MEPIRTTFKFLAGVARNCDYAFWMLKVWKVENFEMVIDMVGIFL